MKIWQVTGVVPVNIDYGREKLRNCCCTERSPSRVGLTCMLQWFCNLIALNCSDKRRWITFTCQRIGYIKISERWAVGLLAKEMVNVG